MSKQIDIQIPPGLSELMQDFTVVALKEMPTDIVDFAAEYFTKLRDSNKKYGVSTKPKSKGVKFQAEESESDSDEEPGEHCLDFKFKKMWDS